MGESDRFSVHRALGGGAVADLLLWKNLYPSAALLGGSTALWFIFEIAGYNILTFVSNVLFLLVVIFFLWARAALILNRPLPPLPNLELSEETVLTAACKMCGWLNHALSIARGITIIGELRLLIKVSLGLWIISYLGGLVNLVTLVYICVLLSLSLPVLYDQYQDQIDEKLRDVCQKIDHKVLKKVIMLLKGKKLQ